MSKLTAAELNYEDFLAKSGADAAMWSPSIDAWFEDMSGHFAGISGDDITKNHHDITGHTVTGPYKVRTLWGLVAA